MPELQTSQFLVLFDKTYMQTGGILNPYFLYIFTIVYSFNSYYPKENSELLQGGYLSEYFLFLTEYPPVIITVNARLNGFS